MIDTSPRFLALDLRQQLVAVTFEHALDWLVDHELDLTNFDQRYRNDTTGAPGEGVRTALGQSLRKSGIRVRWAEKKSAMLSEQWVFRDCVRV